MKRVVVVCLAVLIFLSCTVAVHAEGAKQGLHSTWYQKKGIQEGDTESAKFTEFLGTSKDPKENWASTRKKLFENLEEVGKITVHSFEIASRDESSDWADLAADAGVVRVGNEQWAPDYVIIKYEGFIVAKEPGEYKLQSSYVDNGFVCYINDKLVFEYWGAEMWLDDSEGHTGTHEGDKFRMEADKAYKFEAYYMEEHGGEVLQMDVSKDGEGAKPFVNAGLMLFTAEPTADELHLAKQTPTPKPTPSPTPTKAPATVPVNPTSTVASTAKVNSENLEDGQFPVLPVVIGAGVLIVAGAILWFVKKKR